MLCRMGDPHKESDTQQICEMEGLHSFPLLSYPVKKASPGTKSEPIPLLCSLKAKAKTANLLMCIMKFSTQRREKVVWSRRGFGKGSSCKGVLERQSKN